MTDSPGNSGKGAPPPGEGAVRSPGRRRLLQAGASAPVIMTVVSRPVLAVQCDSPSGFTSLNVSHPGPATCTGASPATVLAGLTSSQINEKFDKLFPTDSTFGSALVGEKIGDVLAPTTTVLPWLLGQQIVTAYYNVAAGRIPSSVLTQAQIKAIWFDYSKNGNFSPRIGATWNYNEIVAYLQSTRSS